MPWRAIPALLGAVATFAACVPSPRLYVPASPRFGVSDGIRVQLTSAVLGLDASGHVSTLTARVQLLGATPLALRSAWLTHESAPRCSGGTPAASIQQEAGSDFDERPYAFVVLARFDVADDPGALSDKHIDFWFVRGPERDCVRVRVAAPRVASPSWESGRTGFVGFSMRAPVAPPDPEFVTVSGVVGVWVGRGRLWMEPGLVGPLSGVSLGLFGEWLVIEKGGFALGAGGGYTLASVGTIPRARHGPELALRLRWSVPRWRGEGDFASTPQQSPFEVFVPLQYVHDGRTNTGVPVIGIGLALTLG